MLEKTFADTLDSEKDQCFGVGGSLYIEKALRAIVLSRILCFGLWTVRDFNDSIRRIY